MGCNGKKKYYIILKQFLSVKQNYGEIFLRDLFRKQGLLRSRLWRFEFSFAENKKEKTHILNVGSIHDNLHTKLNMVPQDKAITSLIS